MIYIRKKRTKISLVVLVFGFHFFDPSSLYAMDPPGNSDDVKPNARSSLKNFGRRRSESAIKKNGKSSISRSSSGYKSNPNESETHYIEKSNGSSSLSPCSARDESKSSNGSVSPSSVSSDRIDGEESKGSNDSISPTGSIKELAGKYIFYIQQKDKYLNLVINRLKKSKSNQESLETIKLILCTCIFFTGPQDLFSQMEALKQKHSKKVSMFLGQLAWEGSPPYGFPRLLLAKDELIKLASGLFDVQSLLNKKEREKKEREYNSSLLKQSPSFEAMPSTMQKLENGADEFDWANFDEMNFALALIVRDQKFWEDISPTGIHEYFNHDDTTGSKSIKKFLRICDGTTDALALKIIAMKEEKEREGLIKKLRCVGRELFQKNNFNGTIQIYMALRNPVVMQLSKKLPLDDKWENIASIFANIKTYDDHLANLTKDVSYIPVFSLLFNKIGGIYNECKSKTGESFLEGLDELEKLLSTFLISQTQQHQHLMPSAAYIDLVNGFRKSSSAILDGLGKAISNFNLEITIPKEIAILLNQKRENIIGKDLVDNWDIQCLAGALTKREEHCIQALTPEALFNQAKNQDKKDRETRSEKKETSFQALTTIGSLFDGTIHFFAQKIKKVEKKETDLNKKDISGKMVSQPDSNESAADGSNPIFTPDEKKIREFLVKKLLWTSHILLEKNNFHSAIQIYLAISDFDNLGMLKEDKKWKELSTIFNPEKNYEAYRRLVSNKKSENAHYIPFISDLTKNLTLTCEKYKGGTDPYGRALSLENLRNFLEDFSICRTSLKPERLLQDEYFELVCGFKEIITEEAKTDTKKPKGSLSL